jgi:hypothetical protein
MAGNGAERDAIRLAERDIFIGEKYADGYHFNPGQT